MIRYVSLLLFCLTLVADPIPSTNRVEWSRETVGVEGGIPTRTTIAATLSSGASLASVQSAIDACASNQVVFLGAGTYNWSGTLNMNGNGVTLRGAGPGVTTIIGNVAGPIINIESGVYNGTSEQQTLASGYTKGSSNVVRNVADTDLKVGYHVIIDQLNDEAFVNNRGVGSAPDERTDTTPEGDGRRALNQVVEVKAINTTTVTIWPPLYWTYTAGLSPQLHLWKSSSSSFNYVLRSGVEDLTITNKHADGEQLVKLSKAANCWVKNISGLNVGSGAVSSFVGVFRSYRCEVRHCWFGGQMTTPSGQGYGVELEYQTCASLVEDNIFHATRDFVKCNAGSSGNVVIYNFHTNAVANTDVPNFTVHSGGTHSAHPMMNLFEGNASYKPVFDFYWGSSSHQTIFRNWWRGLMPYSSQSGAAIIIDTTNSFYNVFGNILGYSGITSHSGFSGFATTKLSPASDDYDSQYAGIRFGYYSDGDDGGGIDSDAQWVTTLVGNNYDYVDGSTNWYSGVTPVTLPDSYFYLSKPSNFGSLTWPPISPSNPTYSTSITNIPAGYRYQFGVDPSLVVASSIIGGKVAMGGNTIIK